MLWVHFFVVLLFIFIGTRIGGIGIGFAGGLGVVVLAALGLTPGSIPLDVISIIMAVICTISAMQQAGGMTLLVKWAEDLLRKHPKHIVYLAPAVTYTMTLCAGTGHTAFSTLPVIAEVAKGQGIRPSRPLAIATVASQIAITASPISAAVVFFAGELEKQFGIGYLQLLAIWIPTTFLACMVGAFVSQFMGKELKDNPVYQERLAKGLVKLNSEQRQVEIQPHAKRSVILFLCTVLGVMLYATLISKTVGLIENPIISRNEAIISFMLAGAALITLFCKVDASTITSSSTFKSGMSAAICVMGVAWLGNTFVGNYLNEIKDVSANLLNSYPWMLAVILFFASTLLYSQAATTKALIPAALALGVSPVAAIASFAAVSALFVLPTYPTLLAAVEMDDTGSTRIGRYVFNHPFLVPGVVAISLSVLFTFFWAGVLL